MTAVAWTPEDWRDFYAERAAIIEFDAGLDRLEAEARAMGEILQMIAGLRTDAPNAPNKRMRQSGNSDPEKRLAYQRELMRKRRATRQARVVHA